MKAGPAAFQLIKRFEGLRLEAYRCPAGVWTIGWGHTAGVQPGDRITVERAEELLAEDVAQTERDLAKVVRVPITQGQCDALVSLCFNLSGGAAGLVKIAPRLLASLNRGDCAGAAQELLDIDHANGHVLLGLARRRQAEQAVFLSQA